jgi:hypothetical protein
MNLKDASIEEWNGYLIVLVDGAIFMADSRQRYANEIGVVEYEWYYLENIGVYENQYQEYFYSSDMPNELEDFVIDSTYPLMLAPENLRNMIVNPPNEEGNSTVTIKNAWKAIEVNGYQYKFYFDYVLVNNEAYLCESKGNYTGGVFDKARIVKTLDSNIFFGTDAGVICSFNFDKRNELGEIPSEYYSFDERTIHCGCATKMDNCGVPHLTKKTVKKSMVVKTKSFQTSAAKIKVRTNKKTYNQIARINSTLFSFENMDFADFSFITTEQSLFSVREKEKQWVEKQYYIYSDEYLKPFALYYISFRYNISGRYKE